MPPESTPLRTTEWFFVTVFAGTLLGAIFFGDAGIILGFVAYSFHLYENGLPEIVVSAAIFLATALILRYLGETALSNYLALSVGVMLVLTFIYKALGRYAKDDYGKEPEGERKR